MANISISASPNQFTITLDQCDWTNLQIKENGVWVNILPQPNGVIQYTGSTNIVEFKAIAGNNIIIVNPASTLYLTGPDQTHTYIAIINYDDVNSDFCIKGALIRLDDYLPIDSQGPLLFSQQGMTGEFSVAS